MKEAAALVKRTQVPGMDRLFVLGCFERRVTVYSQQVRALNLIWALQRTNLLERGKSRVAVVGAGAAGLTAAAAAGHLGTKVDLYERADSPMHLQLGCSTRWLHPRIYDWPAEGWERSTADLPMLNWESGTAGNVATALVGGFDRIAKLKQITLHEGVRNLEIHRMQPRKGREATTATATRPAWRVQWFDRKRNRHAEHDVVILAVGFGVEREIPYAPRLSYWRVDTLDQSPLEEGDSKLTYLISGIGDGGLIDVLRSHQRGFVHEEIVEHYLSLVNRRLQKQLLDIETRAHERFHRSGEAAADEYLSKHYAKLTAPAVDAALRERARQSVHVVLVGRSVHPISIRSAIHNRFLVSRLLFGNLGAHPVEFRVGTLRDVTPVEFRFAATIESASDTARGRVTTLAIDRVVVRHGAESPLQRDFPAVHQAMTAAALQPDPAMPEPLWETSFWGTKAGRQTQKTTAAKRAALAPRIVARFELDGGTPRSYHSYDVDHFWIELSIQNAPNHVTSVEYELDDSYNDPTRRVFHSPNFAETITSYGDFVVTATLSNGKRTKCKLSRALELGHPAPHRSRSIAWAITELKKY
jgi:hypothetical protein